MVDALSGQARNQKGVSACDVGPLAAYGKGGFDRVFHFRFCLFFVVSDGLVSVVCNNGRPQGRFVLSAPKWRRFSKVLRIPSAFVRGALEPF
tara:strand:- start:144 stop:419 length:276 start_codon:yes stop_codon:yes gene_type:complete